VSDTESVTHVCPPDKTLGGYGLIANFCLRPEVLLLYCLHFTVSTSILTAVLAVSVS